MLARATARREMVLRSHRRATALLKRGLPSHLSDAEEEEGASEEESRDTAESKKMAENNGQQENTTMNNTPVIPGVVSPEFR